MTFAPTLLFTSYIKRSTNSGKGAYNLLMNALVSCTFEFLLKCNLRCEEDQVNK